MQSHDDATGRRPRDGSGQPGDGGRVPGRKTTFIAQRLVTQIGVAHVASVLLDHVDQQPPQARGPAVGPGKRGQPVKAAVGEHLGGGHGRTA